MADLDQCIMQDQMQQWGFTSFLPHEVMRARDWYDRTHTYSVFATAIIFPWTLSGVAGLVCAVSTPESTRIQRGHPPGQAITHPGWMAYLCYFCPGLCLLNWHGMTDPAYGAALEPRGMLGDLLDQLCHAKGIPNWRSMYAVVRGGAYLGGLRNLLRFLDVPVWLELASGSSRRVYAGLDVFVRLFAGQYESTHEARYLVYDRDAAAVSSRRVPGIEDWFYYFVWESVGQVVPNFEYIVEDFIEISEAMVLHSATPVPHVAHRRMDVMIRHMSAGPPPMLPYFGTSAIVPYGLAKAKAKAKPKDGINNSRF